MRHLLVIATCLSVIGCDAFEFSRFDIHRMQAWRRCPTPTGKVEAHLLTDASHCGVCGNACGDGVACVEGECNYSTRIHCGGSGRTCVGFEGGVDVDCVYVGEADFDPELGPVVRGYACAPVASTPMEPLDEPITPPIVEPVDLVVGDPPLEPDWILVPGRSTNCREQVDRRCYFTEVEVRDACGETCTAHIEHDFELMTTEMSRAMYRDLVLQCACAGNEPPLCAELCRDDAEAEARPVTGLSWCEAYEACQAVGGRLPTLIERARVEAMADVERGLFTRPGVCGEWVDSVGSAPRVAECFDVPETLEMDRVDGLEGAVPIGTGSCLRRGTSTTCSATPTSGWPTRWMGRRALRSRRRSRGGHGRPRSSSTDSGCPGGVACSALRAKPVIARLPSIPALGPRNSAFGVLERRSTPSRPRRPICGLCRRASTRLAKAR